MDFEDKIGCGVIILLIVFLLSVAIFYSIATKKEKEKERDIEKIERTQTTSIGDNVTKNIIYNGRQKENLIFTVISASRKSVGFYQLYFNEDLPEIKIPINRTMYPSIQIIKILEVNENNIKYTIKRKNNGHE